MLPILETARLRLRPRCRDDLKACLTMDSDPEITRFVGGQWDDPKEYEAHLLRRITTAYPPGLGYWSLFPRRDPGRFLGWVSLVPYGGDHSRIEIGWRVIRAEWGNGYATEAAAAILHHGLATVGLKRIAAYVHPDNTRSMRVAEKIGMTFVGDGDYLGEPCKTYETALTGE